MNVRHALTGPVELPDGSVIVPPHLAGPVRRILMRDLGQHIRADGGAPSAGVRQLVYALGRAEQHHDQAGDRFATEPTPATSPTLEISTADAATLLECSAKHVRSLVRSGRILGRRAGQRAWLIDHASLDAWRYQKGHPPMAPSLREAIGARIDAQQRKDDPEQLARVAELAKTNPTAYADLPAELRQRAALHATQAAAADSSTGDAA